jgi:AsmA protein
MTLKADFGLSADGMAAKNLNLTLDGMTATGGFSLVRGKDKPQFRADLSLDRLDLNTYFGKTLKPLAAATTQPSAQVSGTGVTGPFKPVTADGAEWNAEPINLSALSWANGEMALSASTLKWRNITLGKTLLKVGLKDGVMRSRLSEIELYGGKGSGSVTIEAAGEGAKLEANFALHAIDVQPFLTDAAGLNKLAGRGDVSFNFIGSGHSQLEIVKSLMGQGRMELADGAIVGVNAAAGIKALENGQFGGWDSQPSAKTDFGSMTATATVTNGVLDNRDLVVTAPVLRLAGAGTANLPARTIDYTVQTTLADPAADEQGTAGAAGGLSIPVHLQGPWAKPVASLDLKAIAKNPQGAIDAVKKAVGKFAASKQGKALGDLIGGLLGKPAKASDPPADPTPAPAQ